MIKVFGHKAPDTDATCAPIAYAWYLTKTGKKAEAFVLGNLNKETLLVLKTAKVTAPKILNKLSEGDDVVIVDTNNPEELPENLDLVNILQIVDHHKLAGLTTGYPLEIYMMPLGSSCTLVYQLMAFAKIKPTTNIATLLASGIISDTLNLSSPTTTDTDKSALKSLAKLAKLNTDKHTAAMFDAKSDLTGLSSKDILLMDSKLYDFGKKKVRLSSLETTKPERVKALNVSLTKEMEKLKKSEKLDMLFFFIVDIFNSNSELLVSSTEEEGVAKKAFGKTFKDGYMFLPKVVSRKKQMAPAIEKIVK